ncbi:unnamed protein product [Trichogramma brassicae]|uniref:Secreted protein n=1 Tax=Trichogramma brassicae TaxID=86971 RepID=A0A6H5INV7_9HYME|nr:unnamed protein product [Trichogramma brassicae]
MQLLLLLVETRSSSSLAIPVCTYRCCLVVAVLQGRGDRPVVRSEVQAGDTHIHTYIRVGRVQSLARNKTQSMHIIDNRTSLSAAVFGRSDKSMRCSSVILRNSIERRHPWSPMTSTTYEIYNHKSSHFK